MRGLFGLVGLLVALVIVGTLVRKQMTAVRVTVPALETPANASASAPVNASSGPGNVAQQSQQMQQQIKQAVEGAMQARPMPDDQ